MAKCKTIKFNVGFNYEVPEQIAKKMLYHSAGIIADETKHQLKKSIKKPTGSLESSMGISSIKRNSKGEIDVHVGFDGYDGKGVAEQIKARVLNSGRKDQVNRRKMKFVQKAVTAKQTEAENKMEEIFKEELPNLYNSKGGRKWQ